VSSIAVRPTTRERPSPAAWFDSGRRRPYDPLAREILRTADDAPGALHVFEKVVADEAHPDTRWTSFLPGFPDGSYGFAHLDALLGDDVRPRLFVEYVGQGDSDAPRGYKYSTLERADLVEAMWHDHGVTRTFVVSFDYSSLVTLELLHRQVVRDRAGRPGGTRIEKVLIVNGGLFADSHSHPWNTTPLLRSRLGGPFTTVAGRSFPVAKATMRSARLWSEEFRVGDDRLRDEFDVWRRRDGFHMLHSGAGFVVEHQALGDRLDLARIHRELGGTVEFHVGGSEHDPYEPRQVAAARERIPGLDIRTYPGGHYLTSEHPDLFAQTVRELAAGGGRSASRAG
jgi:pimeloyl-ACP methyl ester carboxylesterase